MERNLEEQVQTFDQELLNQKNNVMRRSHQNLRSQQGILYSQDIVQTLGKMSIPEMAVQPEEGVEKQRFPKKPLNEKQGWEKLTRRT